MWAHIVNVFFNCHQIGEKMKCYYFLHLFAMLSGLMHSEACYAHKSSERRYPVLQDYCERKLNQINPYSDLEGFLDQVQEVKDGLLQTEVQIILNAFKERLGPSYLLFTGLPVDRELIPTPIKTPQDKKSFVSEFCLSLFGVSLGQPFNYIQEENGNIFRNIRPFLANRDEQTSDSSRSTLELHTETPFHPIKPDFLMLYCLRADRDGLAYTLVSDLENIITELDEETIGELEKSQFLIDIDYSFGNTSGEKFTKVPEPILYREKGQRRVTYDHLMQAITLQGSEALEKMTLAVRKVQEKILLEPGDLLIIDNKRAIHGRSPFNMYGDGYDRWLQRVYISIDESFVRSIPYQGRIITKQF